MLLADRVVSVRLDHRGQVALLDDPDAVVGEAVAHISDEVHRPVEVVEHRNRGHDLRLAAREFCAQEARREEVGDQLDARRIEAPELPARGVHADQVRAVLRIGLEQRAVVGADVDDEVALAEADELEDVGDLPA